MVGSLLRGGTVGAALAVTIGLASTLAACASTTSTSGSPVGAAGAQGGSTIHGSAPIPSGGAPSSSASSPSAPNTVNPGGPMGSAPPTAAAPPGSAPTMVPTLPAKSRYVPIDQETQSPDGRTLYLEIEARGGACGQFVVVLQQSASAVRVGLAQLMPKVGVMCPMYIGPRTFTVKLTSPVGPREVIDLATGKRLGP